MALALTTVRQKLRPWNHHRMQKLVLTEPSLTPAPLESVSKTSDAVENSRDAGVQVDSATFTAAVTPFMSALCGFPRHIYEGAPLSPSLASLMPEELVGAVRSARAAYTQFWNARFQRAPLAPLNDAERVIAPQGTQPDVWEHTVVPLWRTIEKVWSSDSFAVSVLQGLCLPIWFSSFRVSELQRLLEVCARLERFPGGDTMRSGRVWLGGVANGKTQLLRVCALIIALLHPRALVGYCEYNKVTLAPFEILRADLSHAQFPSLDLTDLLDGGRRFIVFFADEVEHLYYRRDHNALHQISLLSESAHALSTISGSVAELPALISGRTRLDRWGALQTLSPTKHMFEHIPPITNLAEARSLANAVAPNHTLTDDMLREMCWFGAGALSYMIRAVRVLESVTIFRPCHAPTTDGLPKTPNIPDDPQDPFSAVLQCFWQQWKALHIERDPFALPPIAGSELVAAIQRVCGASVNPHGALENMHDRCLLYSDQYDRFRLVHPRMVEQYDEATYGSLKNMLERKV